MDRIKAAIFALALAAAPASAAPAPAPIPQAAAHATAPADCSYDRKAMLALDYPAFDEQADGWREVDHRHGCTQAAAELIALYRERREHQVAYLAWHEGQLRAAVGQTDRAIALMEQSRALGGHEPAYVDATIAFLKHDKPALLEARARLAALPEPAGFARAAEKHRVETGEPLNWPLNLSVVDRLIACFDRPYGEAYGDCRAATPKSAQTPGPAAGT